MQNVLTGARKNPPRWTWAAEFFTACRRYVENTGLDPEVVLGSKMAWHQHYSALLEAPETPAARDQPEPVPGPGSPSHSGPDGPSHPGLGSASRSGPDGPSRSGSGSPSHPSRPAAGPPAQPPPKTRDDNGADGGAVMVSVPVSPLESLTVPVPGSSPDSLADLFLDQVMKQWDGRTPDLVPDNWPAAESRPREPTDTLPTPPARPQPMLELPQPVEQEATYAALTAIGEKKSLTHERMRDWFGPRGAALWEAADALCVAGPCADRYARANLQLGILLVNRNALHEGNQLLQRVRQVLPEIAIGPVPCHGDYFFGTVPADICRQVARDYRAAGRTDKAEQWLRYGNALVAPISISLAISARGKHARQAGTFQHHPLTNAAEIHRLFWQSEPRTGEGRTTFPLATSGH
ncbi:hypothetical protein ABZ912_19020 [Nonomuraea angiospora]|uniref:hypothetical protein n=1 Tax=Nonomuraea angiospora TaxID=46172 RepID=UPI0033C41D67